MPARVQIIVDAKDGASGILRGISSQFGQFGSMIQEVTTKQVAWGNVAAIGAEMVINGIKDAIAVTQEYAQDVRDLALASGTGAEEASRMIQVLDDYQLTAEDAMTATRTLTKQGLAPTIDTLIDLSRQYNTLNSATEKNAFLQQNVGRASKEWLNLMAQGPEKIRALNESVNENLILTDKNIKAAEEYRLALDDYNDAVMGVKVSIGNQLLPVLTDSMFALSHNAELLAERNRLLENGAAADMNAANRMALINLRMREQMEAVRTSARVYDDWMIATQNETTAQEELEAALKATNAANTSMLGLITNMQTEIDNYTDKNQELTDKLVGLTAEQSKFKEHSKDWEEYQAKINETKTAIDELATEHENAAKRIAFSLLQSKAAVDGLTDVEFEGLLRVGEQWGIFDKQTVAAARNVNTEMENLAKGFGHLENNADQASHGLDNAEKGVVDLATKEREYAIPQTAILNQELEEMKTSQGTYYYNYVIAGTGNFPRAPGKGLSGFVGGVQEQTGGEVYAGMPYTVGETGAEPFFPAVNGRILGHAESLHALTLGGGGGGAMYFYGNVMIAANSKTGGDLMSWR